MPAQAPVPLPKTRLLTTCPLTRTAQTPRTLRVRSHTKSSSPTRLALLLSGERRAWPTNRIQRLRRSFDQEAGGAWTMNDDDPATYFRPPMTTLICLAYAFGLPSTLSLGFLFLISLHSSHILYYIVTMQGITHSWSRRSSRISRSKVRYDRPDTAVKVLHKLCSISDHQCGLTPKASNTARKQTMSSVLTR